MADDEPDNQMRVYAGDFYYPKTKGFSNHRNFYQMKDDQLS